MMKALWIEGPGKAKVGELPVPVPPAGWVRLKVLAASVCGSDLNVYRFGRSYQVDRRVSGHEFTGVIDEVGEGVTEWKTGQRVCVFPTMFCNECEDCREGYINTCKNRKYIGGRDYDGGFAEYTVVPESSLLKVPENIPDIEAAMTEPFAVSLHALNQAGGRKLKDRTLVVYGAGPIGLFAMEAARYYGVKQVILLDLVQGRLDIAREHGADQGILASASPEELQEQIMQLTGGRGADAVIDTVCADVTIDNSLHFCKRHGTVVVLSMPRKNSSLDLSYIVRSEINLVGSYTYTTEMKECLEILGSGKVSVKYIADPIVPLQEGPEALQKLVQSPDKCLKALLIP